ncbi:MAG: 3-oxoacyl-ACP reductase, partial [Pseudomonadota bacterium]|nr:3-oxoacyl-ACP reductase [Pseudomonadota bacterium]
MRLENKIAVIIGAGQTPGMGEAIGNGRATALLFAR